MFYIVREWEEDAATEYHYDRQQEAEAHMQQTANHAELFLFMDGREWFMYSVND